MDAIFYWFALIHVKRLLIMSRHQINLLLYFCNVFWANLYSIFEIFFFFCKILCIIHNSYLHTNGVTYHRNVSVNWRNYKFLKIISSYNLGKASLIAANSDYFEEDKINIFEQLSSCCSIYKFRVLFEQKAINFTANRLI